MEVEGVVSSGEQKKEKERDIRRARGQISCAECRRLKLKCDKQIPCSSCVRRGCMSLCPNGVQLSKENHGTRHPQRPRLVDKERLRTQVLEMGERIRKLENELRILHSCHSPDIHPLLSEELLRVKAIISESERVTSRRSTSSDVDDQFIESFGTLAVSDGGTERFLGASGTTESLQIKGFPPPAVGLVYDYRSNWRFIPEIWKNNEVLVQIVKAHLPSQTRATELCEAYLNNISWFCRPIRREQIMEELLPVLYSDHILQMDVHDLSLILMTLSAGAAGDLSLPAYNEEAELFYELSMMAMSMRSLLESEGASLSTVQTLMLGGVHHLVSGRMNSLEPIWKIQSFACVLATVTDRDPANWKLEEKLVQRRRQVFWELFVVDKWKSLACGRPPAFKLGDIDCLYADDTDATDDQDGNIVASPWHWKTRFCKEVANFAIEKFCSSKPVTYAEVLELDRIIEDFSDHVILASPETANQTYRRQQPSDVLRYIAVHLYRNISLIHVHRGFFAEALMKFPSNPLDSPFAHSFSAAYRGSVKLLGVLRTKFDELSPLLIRMWPMWAHSLTAAVIVGSVALHCRGSPMAAPAAIELDHAITLFEKAIIHPVVETGLVSSVYPSLHNSQC
ncbi:hypothetical protein SCHPADRAFT_820145 [Schizopora paradoxa]|uniref:Zn(2)-C6 fungal-type domain-containing protein n=1 Tax=Schizopora paradoxa TaxID=27342 RepID=A0A0H2S2S0_9AGAM|nr:hypothetical protein SCHPADRAFT_820145 [Schizopora paradoxa]